MLLLNIDITIMVKDLRGHSGLICIVLQAHAMPCLACTRPLVHTTYVIVVVVSEGISQRARKF